MNLDNKKKIIISAVLLLILVVAFAIYMIIENENHSELDLENEVLEQNTENAGNIANLEVVNEIAEEKEKIAVHITGEVKKEGIIYLNQGARIVDAIKEAGGETKQADLSQVNLAYELQDGQKIYIPDKKEKISQYITENSGTNVIIEDSNTSTQKGGSGKVNINTANQSELDRLPGIGPSLAERIIEYREENGNFKNIEDLQNVKGIGDAKFADIKDKVTV